MSEDAHFSGDEPLFASPSNQRGPGFTIYTCPRCGGERRDGLKCQKCEQSAHPSSRYAFQRFDWDPNSCPCCGNLTFVSEDEHGTHELACDRCGLPADEHATFIQGVQRRSTMLNDSINLRIDRPEPAVCGAVRVNGYAIPPHIRFREAMTGKREFHQPVPSAPEHVWLSGMQITWDGDDREDSRKC